MDISQIDKNFANYFSFEGLKTYDINQDPFKLYGLYREEGEQDFKRLPHSLGKGIDNDGIHVLYTNTAGIRLRFRTDSQRIVISYILPDVTIFDHMPATGVSCFDLYADGNYHNVFRVGTNLSGKKADVEELENAYSSGLVFQDRKERDILINFPLYNNVSKVYISLEEEASLKPGDTYTHEKPVVYYGSSITQGGCASHPGNCYSGMISRRLDTDFVNLGFSGSCKAEPEMCDFIGNMDMSVFVFDYDHNAPSPEYLESTHEPFFKKFRQMQPDTPVIFASDAGISHGVYRERRKEIIRRTYENALKAGDKNVYFIDGGTIYNDVGGEYCEVDNCHPNDLGFWCMANAYGAVIEEILKK